MLRVGDEDVEESGGEPRRSPAMHVNVTPLYVTIENAAQCVHVSEPTSQLAVSTGQTDRALDDEIPSNTCWDGAS